ncbi:centrosomal protein of 55 kDa-like isoform X2 [Phyllopteryx taeniolatus]|uniref:centrosomal protein of 55 kDa-like isoform X2 n=1 Tax=Phyllopteryx taeniolatus TaxID=161469 RepID=UPI002AD20F70|nr:centrosomal protein of 55 kDa-like isoform X2 [Phyllopteryx taeniolatus]
MSCDKRMNLWEKPNPSLSRSVNLKEWTIMSTAKDDASDEQFSSDVAVLQKSLKNALAKNHQWLAYDQQREAYVRTVVDRMLWLDKQLDQAVRAQLSQHNKEHSEEERVSQMKEHFESLVVIGRDNLVILKQQLDVTLHDLANAKIRYEEKEIEANDLMQQLQRCAVEKEQMMDEMKALQWKLDEETRRTANLEKQSAGIGSSRPTTRVGISGMENGWMDGYSPFNDPGQQCSDKSTQRTEGRKEFRKGGIVGTKETREKSLFQRKKDERKSSLFQSFMIKRNNASQDKIADLEGQVHSSSQDLEDEMENCSYLKRQLVRVVNMLRRSDDQLAFYEKRKQREEDYRKEEEEPIYVEMKPCWTSSPNDSSLDRSSLDCPRCQIRCPISQYRQMMDHLEVCLN